MRSYPRFVPQRDSIVLSAYSVISFISLDLSRLPEFQRRQYAVTACRSAVLLYAANTEAN